MIRRLLRTLADIAITRLELVALEIEAERVRLAQLCIRATLTLFLLFTGILLGVGGLLLWADPAHRAAVAGGLAAAFLMAAAATAWSWHRVSCTRRPLRRAPPHRPSP